MSEFQRIPLDRIVANPDQPRKHFNRDELAELADSIRERGLMQPIKVRPIDKGRFMICMGERRYRAHCLLREKGQLPGGAIDCIVQPMDETEMAVQAIVENLQRADITPMEEARAFAAMLDRGFTVAELAKAIGTMQWRVQEKLALLQLDDQVAKLIETGQLAVTTASLLVEVPKHKQCDIVRRIAAGTLRPNTSDIRAAVGAVKLAEAQPDLMTLPKAPSRADREALSRLEEQVDRVVAMLNAGFKDGECVAAKRVDPTRMAVLADKLVLAKQTVGKMERQLRDALAQSEMLTTKH